MEVQNKGNIEKIYAIEPVLANYKRLEKMIQMNGLEEIVYPFNTALGDMEGMVQFSVEAQDGATTGNATWVKAGNATAREANCTCRITKLDTFVQEHRIKTCCLIKMDAEGAERDIIAGGRAFLTHTRPVIFSEFNPYCANEFSYSFYDFKVDMQNLSYLPYILRLDSLLALEQSPTKITNIFWIPKEKLDIANKAI